MNRGETAEQQAGHILLVEDDGDTREVLTLLLQQHGYQVTAAHDGAQALAMLESGLRMNALVTDYQLPGCYGDALIRRVRALPQRIPAILMSAQPDVAQLAHCCGADAAFIKTEAISGLLATLACLLP